MSAEVTQHGDGNSREHKMSMQSALGEGMIMLSYLREEDHTGEGPVAGVMYQRLIASAIGWRNDPKLTDMHHDLITSLNGFWCMIQSSIQCSSG